MSSDAAPPSDAGQSSENRPVSSRTRWLAWLPVALLLIGIGAQAIAMYSVNANPQAGSGFSMFSTVDFVGSRRSVVTSDVGGATVFVKVPASHRDDLLALNREPTDAKARALGNALASLRWTIEGGQATVGGVVDLDYVDIVVRGLEADGRTLSARILASNQS